jgi:hypothetical protein
MKKLYTTNKLILLFVVAMGILVFFILKNIKSVSPDSQATPKPQGIKTTIGQPTVAITQRDFDYYVNRELGFLVKYPRFLYLKEVQDKDGYIVFLKFEENKFSTSKGFAIGVSRRTVQDEEKYVKDTFTKEGGGVSSQTKSDLNGIEIAVLNFKDSSGAEEVISSVGFFKFENLTFSVSSPSEIFEETLKNISLFGQIKGCEDEKIKNGDNLKKYCGGELCLQGVDKLSCNNLDVVSIKNGKLFDLSKDGVPDCTWIKDLDSKFYCAPIF